MSRQQMKKAPSGVKLIRDLVKMVKRQQHPRVWMKSLHTHLGAVLRLTPRDCNWIPSLIQSTARPEIWPPLRRFRESFARLQCGGGHETRLTACRACMPRAVCNSDSTSFTFTVVHRVEKVKDPWNDRF